MTDAAADGGDDDLAVPRRHSVTIAGHRTSVSLEGAFWDELKRIAAARDVPLARLVAEIDAARRGNLSAALRVFVLAEVKRGG